MQHRYLCSLLVQRKIMTVHVRWNKSLNLLTDCSVQTCQLYGHRRQVKILDNVKETSNLDKKIMSRKLIHVEQVCGLLKRIQGAHSGSKIASLRSCSDCKIHISETVTGIRYSCTYLDVIKFLLAMLCIKVIWKRCSIEVARLQHHQ